MIYSDSGKWGYIHIPRTGGNSVVASLLQRNPDSVCDHVFRRHYRATQIMEYLDYGAYRWFAALRPPHKMIESDWRVRQKVVEWIQEDVLFRMNMEPRDYELMMRVVGKSFDQFVEDEYLNGEGSDLAGNRMDIKQGGFWKTYCCDADGSEVGVRMLRFFHLQEDFTAMCNEWGIQAEPLPGLNHIPGPDALWPGDLMARVRERYGYDYKKLNER